MSGSVVFLVFYMTFSNLKNSVNTRNFILEAVDFKIFPGSMPLWPFRYFSRLGRSLCPFHFCYGWPPLATLSPPLHFLSFRRPCVQKCYLACVAFNCELYTLNSRSSKTHGIPSDILLQRPSLYSSRPNFETSDSQRMSPFLFRIP